MVRFDENDKENKYGFTRKMEMIWQLVEAEKSLKDANWKVTPEDEEYYKYCKSQYDFINEGNTGKKRQVIRFFND